MTRREFIKYVETDKWVQFRHALVFLLIIVAFIGTGTWIVSHWPDLEQLTVPHLCLLILAAAGFTAAAMWVIRRGTGRALKCPHCRKPLGGFPAQIVVATGRCGFCGELVIEMGEHS